LNQAERLSAYVMGILRDRLGDRVAEYAFPPPVFALMKGEFVELDLDAGLLSARFPVLESYLNPYGSMQGGMIAAAVDNTLGPLSVLVAPPNVTRRLEVKYGSGAVQSWGPLAALDPSPDRFRAQLCGSPELRDWMGALTDEVLSTSAGAQLRGRPRHPCDWYGLASGTGWRQLVLR